MIRLNIGCGDVPTDGWINYDNSLSVLLARLPGLPSLLSKGGILSPKQMHFIDVVRSSEIRYANVVKGIPEHNRSVEVIYTCHMLEHLSRLEARAFLHEARRVLVRNGIIRIAVPDLRVYVEQYLKNGDADLFVENLYVTSHRAKGLLARLRWLLVGERHHLWMYDAESLCRLLLNAGFENPKILKAGETTIINPGALDLFERAEESVYVEAVNP